MDSMEANKVVAAVLVAGIVFFVTGLVGDVLVRETVPKQTAIRIEVAQTAAPGPPQTAALPPIAPLLAKADPAAGEAYAKRVCAACHSFDEGGKAGVGPNLYGILGAPHGHMQGFNYSTALKGKQGPWTYDELNEWLDKPSAYAPGTRMAFAGITNAQERANVIDWLHMLSAHPEPLPSPTEEPAAGAAPGTAAAQPAAGADPPVASLLSSADPNAWPGGYHEVRLLRLPHLQRRRESRRRTEPVWHRRCAARAYARLCLLRGAEEQAGPVDLRRTVRMAEEAECLRAGYR